MREKWWKKNFKKGFERLGKIDPRKQRGTKCSVLARDTPIY